MGGDVEICHIIIFGVICRGYEFSETIRSRLRERKRWWCWWCACVCWGCAVPAALSLHQRSSPERKSWSQNRVEVRWGWRWCRKRCLTHLRIRERERERDDRGIFLRTCEEVSSGDTGIYFMWVDGWRGGARSAMSVICLIGFRATWLVFILYWNCLSGRKIRGI